MHIAGELLAGGAVADDRITAVTPGLDTAVGRPEMPEEGCDPALALLEYTLRDTLLGRTETERAESSIHAATGFRTPSVRRREAVR